MKQILILISLVLFSFNLSAQKYMTKTGYINFFSSTPIEDINADNYKVSSALDAATGNLVFKLDMKSFEFKKSLMQEHFNENYVESDKFPNSSFKGKITNLAEVDFSTNGKYDVQVDGELTIHGVTKEVSTTGQINVNGENLFAKSEFKVKPADYEIIIPKLVRGKIAEELLVKVEMKYELVK
ncbi:MAG: YceI family protein [Bacteroidales bacterium]|nr:YceI family protein [Bacteroidales bacterium]